MVLGGAHYTLKTHLFQLISLVVEVRVVLRETPEWLQEFEHAEQCFLHLLEDALEC